VDNGSADGSAHAVHAAAPWARVIEGQSNLGFGPAVNVVAARTSSEWLLVANADVAVEPGALDSLMTAGRDARVGCVAPQLVLPGGETQHSVHPFPTVPLTLVFNLGLHRLSSGLSDRLCLEGFWDAQRPRSIPWAIGACLLVRRRAFDEVGGFDERQWMYAEDLDLEWRLRRAGWTIRYEPQARVHHESGAATSDAFGDERSSTFMAATYAMLRRRRGPARTWVTAAINIAGAAGRVAWMTPLAWLSSGWKGARADNRAWLRAHVSAARQLGAGGAK
jgi:GT2 family glycosyltransferase